MERNKAYSQRWRPLKYSVIIPNYNSENFIEETIKSVLNQSLKPHEIIIIDDKSTDTSTKIVNSLKYKSKVKINLITLDTNSGYPSKPRNIGIENVSNESEYVCFLDSDDIWGEKKIELQYKFMKTNNLLASATNVEKKINNFKKNISNIGCGKKLYQDDFKYNNPTKSCSTLLIKKSALSNTRFIDSNEVKGIEDYFFMCELVLKLNEIGFINEKLVYYRQHEGGISSNKIKMIFLRWNTFHYKKKIFKRHNIKIYGKILSELIYLKKQVGQLFK